jgi:hypothetical protein
MRRFLRRFQDNNRNLVPRGVLLESEVPVTGKENIKLLLDRHRQQFSVLKPTPTHALNGHTVLAGERTT